MQNLTPLEIQKQTFSRVLKGYQVDDVRAYLHLIAEEIERLLKDIDRLSRENAMLRDELEDHSQRERILKDTLLSAQKVSEDVKANARNKLQATLDTVQQMIMLDAEQEANDLPITSMYRRSE